MSYNLTPYEALQSALEIAGTQTALAKICGVSQQAVWKWVQSSKRLPAEYVLRVEAATGVSRHLLRPDIYPVEPVEPVELCHRFHGVDRAALRVSRSSSTVPFQHKSVVNG